MLKQSGCPNVLFFIYMSFVYFFNPFGKSKNIVYLLQTCVPSSKVIALCMLELPYIAFKII